MNHTIDNKKTLDIIERLKLAKIGEYEKWEKIIKKIRKDEPLDLGEKEYFSRLTRIYSEAKITTRSKILHTKLSFHDERPPCQTCGSDSEYYCNANDEYFCATHVVGHDPNEF